MTSKIGSDSLVSVADQLFRVLYSSGSDRIIRKFGLEHSAKQLYARLLSSMVDDVQTISVNEVSASFRISSPFEFDLFYNEAYNDEASILRDVLSHVEQDDVFYDVGAHVGTYAILVANALQEGRVIGFEPHPINEQRLRENAALNDGCVESYRYALSDTETRSDLAIDGEPTEATGSLKADNTADAQTVTVETISGDVLINRGETPPPNIVKIDVEGAELDVIRGMRSALVRKECRLVYCECHPDALAQRGASILDIEETLSNFGFDVREIYRRNNQPFFRAKKESL